MCGREDREQLLEMSRTEEAAAYKIKRQVLLTRLQLVHSEPPPAFDRVAADRALPPLAKMLTKGYRMRTYWYELLECFRKIAFIALPIFFDEDSLYLVLSLLFLSFATFSSMVHLKPYRDPQDNTIARACQVQVRAAFHTL